jgi:chromosome partitioning protein
METALIIGVLNPKGGSGKTTLSTNMAHALQLEGASKGNPARVLLVDTDPQGTATDWQGARGPESDLPPVVSITSARAIESPALTHADLPLD